MQQRKKLKSNIYAYVRHENAIKQRESNKKINIKSNFASLMFITKIPTISSRNLSICVYIFALFSFFFIIIHNVSYFFLRSYGAMWFTQSSDVSKILECFQKSVFMPSDWLDSAQRRGMLEIGHKKNRSRLVYIRNRQTSFTLYYYLIT